MKHNDQKIFRGDVFFADFTQATGSEISGMHPIIIVQNNIGNCHSSTVIGVVLTSRNKKESMPTHVVIDEPNCPLHGSMAMAEQIYTIDKQRLHGFIDHLSASSMKQVDEAIRQSLALSSTETTIVCLCGRCLQTFLHLPHHAVRRVDWTQQTKDTCTYCGRGMGFDYWVKNWRTTTSWPGS